jgi:hypothetical protein
MKQLFSTLLMLLCAGYSLGQNLKFANPPAALYSVPPTGTDGSGEYYVYFEVVNLGASPVSLLATRLENNLFAGHGTFFCWDLCYDSTREQSQNPIVLAGNDTTAFAQYIVLKPNNIVGYSEATMVFTDIATGESIQRTYKFSVGGAQAIDPSQADRYLSQPYPQPADAELSLDYHLSPGEGPGAMKLFAADGREVASQALQYSEGTAQRHICHRACT